MTKIKICGITNKQDAINAASLGVDMLGFVFYKNSKRYVKPEVVRDIVNELPPFIGKVGVFVDEDKKKVFDIAKSLKPSKRGELEITDVNNDYIKRGEMTFSILDGWWSDCGTHEALLRANNLVAGKCKS